MTHAGDGIDVRDVACKSAKLLVDNEYEMFRYAVNKICRCPFFGGYDRSKDG